MNTREKLERLDFWELDKLAREAKARGLDVDRYYGCHSGECCEKYYSEWHEETIKALAAEKVEKGGNMNAIEKLDQLHSAPGDIMRYKFYDAVSDAWPAISAALKAARVTASCMLKAKDGYPDVGGIISLSEALVALDKCMKDEVEK